LDEQVLAFFKLISNAENPYSINIYNIRMSKMGEKQRASVNRLLQIFREEKSPRDFGYLNCRMSNIQYLQHADNQTSRLYLEGDKSDIPHLMKMLASPRPDVQQRVIDLNIDGDLKTEILKSIKKVCIDDK
jgi:hypothetical protein